MKKNTKSILQKMVIVLLIVIFLFPNYSSAASSIGGKLLIPINDFLVGIGDGIINITQKIIIGGDAAIEYEKFDNAKGLLENLSAFAIDIPVLGSIAEAVGSWICGSDAYDYVDNLKGIVAIPMIRLGPASIFSNQIELFDVNFFNPISSTSTASQLRNVVALVYNSLRIIAIVGLLSVLVFIGIKIVLGTVSNSDKAKYKEMLIDWIVAICLIFVMHYIMSAAVTFVNKITDIFDLTLTSPEGLDVFFNTMRGEITIQEQLDNETARFGYIIVYLSMIICTIIFVFQYLRRVIYMAFLTMISPLVALTYPIDKINDGQAQAFNMWFKEYMFNLLIQPLHLIIYYVLLVSAQELAKTNVIYAIIAIGFMVPAEKLLRRFFGFEKAQTPGGLFAGPVGLAATMGLAGKIFSPKGHGNGGVKSSSGQKDINDKGSSNKIKYKDSLGTDMSGMSGLNNNNMLESNRNTLKDTEENKNGLLKRTMNGIKGFPGNAVSATKRSAKDLSKRTINGIKRFPGGAVRATKRYSRGILGKNPTRKLKGAGKGIGKVALKGAVGAVGAGLGLATGVATGDFNKAVQNSIAGATGGYKFAGNIGNSLSDINKNVTDALSVDGVAEAYYGKDDYKEKQIQENIKNMQKDYDLKMALDKEFGSKKAKEVRNEILPDCVRYGLTDEKDIMTVAKMNGSIVDGVKVSKEDAIRSVIEVNDIGKNVGKLQAKDSDDLDKTLMYRAKKDKRIQNEEQAQKVVKRTRALMNEASNIKYKL